MKHDVVDKKRTECQGVEGYNRGKLGIVRGIRRRKETHCVVGGTRKVITGGR